MKCLALTVKGSPCSHKVAADQLCRLHYNAKMRHVNDIKMFHCPWLGYRIEL